MKIKVVNIKMKSKIFDQVKPYSYLITRLADGMNYVGIRYKNVKDGRTPIEDFGIKYFSSGVFKKEFKSNPENFKYRLLYTFESAKDAAEWEYKILLRVYKKKSWANMTAAWSYTDRDKLGVSISEGKNKVKASGKTSIEEGAHKLRDFLYNSEEGKLLREEHSKRMKEFQANLTKDQREEISKKRSSNMDFFEASKKAQQTMSKVGSDGLTTLQRKAIKANSTRSAKGEDLSIRAKDMNAALNKKYGEMSEEEFQKAIDGKTDRAKNGLTTRRKRYLQALNNEQC